MAVVIHSKSGCPYCEKAKTFFKENDIDFDEVYYDAKQDDYQKRKDELVSKTNHTTFPQIFVGTEFIGGYTELINSYSTLKFHELCENIGISIGYDF